MESDRSGGRLRGKMTKYILVWVDGGGGVHGDRWVGGEDRVGLLVNGWGGRWRVGVGDCDGMVGGKNGQGVRGG